MASSLLGNASDTLDLGKCASGVNLWSQGRFAARVPLGDIGRDLSPYPFLLISGQDDNDRLLGAALLRVWNPSHGAEGRGSAGGGAAKRSAWLVTMEAPSGPSLR